MAHSDIQTRSALAELAGTPGPWATIYLDASGDRDDPARLSESRRRSVHDSLAAQGASDQLLETVGAALLAPTDAPSPLTRYLIACETGVAYSELLPGMPIVDEVVSWGQLPQLVPLLRHRRLEFRYLVVEAGRDGGDISLYSTGSKAAQTSLTLEGRTDTLSKFKGGGWSHLRYQHHTEEIWKQNEAQLASAVDAVVLDQRPRLIVVSGDIRARQLLVDQLSSGSRELVTELAVHTRADGASQQSLTDFIENRIDELLAADVAEQLDLLRQQLGQDNPAAVEGVGWLVHSLQQAQVSTLFLADGQLGDRTLLALDGAPWVASAPEETAGAGIVAPAPALEALVRAAVMTDAQIRFVHKAQLPGGQPAALLRWSTGVVATG